MVGTRGLSNPHFELFFAPRRGITNRWTRAVRISSFQFRNFIRAARSTPRIDSLVPAHGMKYESESSRLLRLDETAKSADSSLPAFLLRPEGALAYHGFPIVQVTCADGWCFGAITDFDDADGCDSGDGYVVAPDGSRAGLVWDVGHEPTQQIVPPDEERWGVYAVWFPRIVTCVDDLIFNFRSVLPDLKAIYQSVKSQDAR